MTAPRWANLGAPSGAAPIIGFYLLYFATIGVLSPFLPAYFEGLGLSSTQIGLLLAVNPALAMVAPHFWGPLTDRARRPGLVLSVIALGAACSFAPLAISHRFTTIFFFLACYAFFSTSINTVVDSLALAHVAEHGGAYARLRLFGSLGFVLASTVFGFAVTTIDRSTVLVPLALMVGYFLWSLTLHSASVRSSTPPAPRSSLALLRRRELAPFLVATCLHWIACAPFHGTFAIHVQALGLRPWVVGLSAGLGVLIEMGVMFAYPRFAARISPRQLLAVALISSALRWAGMAVVTSPALIVVLSLAHGLTFGAFYLASIAHLSRQVPAHLRASGQALFVSVTFGLGGLIGFLGAGAGYDLLGGHRLFALACVLELIAAAIALRFCAAEEVRPGITTPAPSSKGPTFER